MVVAAFDETDARRLLAALVPDLDVLRVRFLDEGWDNRLFLVNDDVVLRVAKTGPCSDHLVAESITLRAIASSISCPIPRPMFVHRPSRTFPLAAMGYQMLSGVSLVASEVTDAVADWLAPDLARFLTDLHSVPIESVSSIDIGVFTPDEWLTRCDDLVRDVLEELRRALGEGALARFLLWWDEYLGDSTAVAFEPRLVHGDLACEHVLVAKSPWHVTGIIDFGDAMIADPALDLAGFPDNLARTVMRLMPGLGDPDTVWKRRYAYQRISPLHAVRVGLERGSQTLIRSGIDGLRQQLSS